MAIAENQSLEEYCVKTARQAKQAATALALVDGDIKNAWLIESARRLRSSQPALLEANQADIAAAPGYGQIGRAHV
jgi:glutamate-5-semialdehyde dehydrogenase